ncbi:MAG: GNAT family N-acetyltransferase [archaeon]|nr:GNAT family N-acetyltransferase [archaeon]
MKIERLDRNQLRRVSELIYPVWMKTYSDKCTNGPAAAQACFDVYITPDALGTNKVDGGVQFHMVVEDGVDLAVVGTRVCPDGRLDLDKLYVADGMQGRGIGSFAMRFAMDLGRENGCTSIFTHANRLNVSAIRFYERFGLRETEVVHCEHDGAIYDYSTLEGPL